MWAQRGVKKVALRLVSSLQLVEHSWRGIVFYTVRRFQLERIAVHTSLVELVEGGVYY